VTQRIAAPLIPAQVRHNHFNTMRLTLALSVIWSHCFALYYGTEDVEPVSLLLGGAFNAGNIAVRMFFIISGFLIVMSYEQSRGILSYLRKRVARIYPGFIASMPLCAFVIIPLFSTRIDLSAKAVAKLLLGLPIIQPYWPDSNVFGGDSSLVNGALWSIKFEFWCYLGVIALGLLGALRRRWLVLAAALFFTVARVACDLKGVKPGFATDFITGWPYLWTSIAPCFLAGTIGWLWRAELPRSGYVAVGCLVAIIGSAHLNQILFEVLFPYLTAYLTFFLAFSARNVPDAAHWGDFSYGTYLYGFPVQHMLLATMRLPFIAYLLTSMTLSVVMGATSWLMVERHFLTKRSIKVRTGEAEKELSAQTGQNPQITAP
jgi:peptidoglycan/LPS O-acetylase OafA/YrhL